MSQNNCVGNPKRIFFAGNHFGQGGPWTVNKNLVLCLDKKILVLRHKNKILRFVEILLKIARSQIIVFSGVTMFDHVFIPFCRFLNRKIVYIMHGCLALEYKINNNTTNNRGLHNESVLLREADRILCVSQSYSEIIKQYYPQFKEKISYLTNGIDWHLLGKLQLQAYSKQKNKNLIILMGGGRTTKRNLQVCQAVYELNQRMNYNFRVEVYGYYADYDDSKAISKIPCVQFSGALPYQKILERLSESFLFIQNSDIESFSLGVIEALCCGCNVLLTKNVGAKDVISAINENDIIHNNMDLNEIETKILKIIDSPNNKRLLDSIDKNTTSIEYAASRLESIVAELGA